VAKVTRTTAELVAIAKQFLDGLITPEAMVAFEFTEEETRTVVAFIEYEAAYRRDNSPARLRAQRRAKALLRSLVSAKQWREFRSRGCFKVCGSAGGMYQLCLETGAVHGLTLWKGRWYTVTDYCLIHPSKFELPPADTTISHLLLLTADEPAFLAEAHARPFWTSMARYLQARLRITYAPILEEAA